MSISQGSPTRRGRKRGLLAGMFSVPLVAVLLMLEASASRRSEGGDGLSAPALQKAAPLDVWLEPQPYGESWREFLLLPRLARVVDGAADSLPRESIDDQLTQAMVEGPNDQKASFRVALDDWRTGQQQTPLADLRDRVLKGKENLRTIRADDLATARRQLSADVRRLDRLLAAYGRRGTQWREYLLWSELQAQLAAPEVDPEVLFRVWERFSAHHAGLGLPEFSDVALSLRSTIEMADAVDSADLPLQLAASLDAIAAALGDLDSQPHALDWDLLGRRLSQLERLRQVPDIVAAVETRLLLPNFHVRLTEELVAAGFARSVHRREPVTDCILGTFIRGTGVTNGTVQIRLIPNRARAELETRLVAVNDSNNVGRNGPAVIYSKGYTHFVARNRLALDDSGLVAGPSTASATTRSTIRGTSSRGLLLGGVVSSVAYRRALESKPQAERIAARHAEDRVKDRMDRETRELVVQTNRQYRREFQRPLLERGVLPRYIHFSTTEDQLLVAALEAGPDQLGAHDLPPGPPPESALTMSIHESLVNNALQTLFGGRTMKEQEVEELATKFRQKEIARRLESHGDEEPWEITFADRRPISVAFREGFVRVTVRTRRLATAERIAERWSVTATYLVEPSTQGRGRLVRQGDLSILPARFETRPDDRLTTAEAALLTALRRRFERVFEREIRLDPLQLHGRWGEQVGPLDLVAADSRHSWLTIGFERHAANP